MINTDLYKVKLYNIFLVRLTNGIQWRKWESRSFRGPLDKRLTLKIFSRWIFKLCRNYWVWQRLENCRKGC